jgi:hypothetical protein
MTPVSGAVGGCGGLDLVRVLAGGEARWILEAVLDSDGADDGEPGSHH